LALPYKGSAMKNWSKRSWQSMVTNDASTPALYRSSNGQEIAVTPVENEG
jgi:hypothetical protein